MLSRWALAVMIALPMVATTPAYSESERVVIVDLAGTPASADAVAQIRASLTERSYLPAAEPDIRAALEDPLASAAEPLERARAALKAAQKRFADFSMAAAGSELSRAQNEALAALPLAGPEAVALLADVAFLRGRVSEADGKADAADHFRVTARLDPDRAAIDPAQFKPSLVALYARAAASANKGKGAIVLGGAPAGASVEINGREAGTLPITVDRLGDGTHFVLIRAADHKPQAYAAETRGKRARLEVALEPMNRGEKLTALRQRLVSGASIETSDLAAVATAAAAPVVVLVRESGGTIEAASYSGRSLGGWTAPGALTFRATEPITAPVADPSSPIGSDAGAGEAKPWYLTWKGAAAAGAAAAVITVLAVVLLSGDTEFEVGGVCTGIECQ